MGRGRGLFGAQLLGGKGRGMGRGKGGKGRDAAQASGSAPRRTLADMERDFAHHEEGSSGNDSERVVELSSGDDSESSGGSWSAITRPQRAGQPIGGQVRILGAAASLGANARRLEQESADRELAQRLALEQEEAASRERAARVERRLEEARVRRAAARGGLELSDEMLRGGLEDASEWPELPKPSLGSSLCPKPFVPTRHVPPVNRAMSKSAQRKANAAARFSQDGQPRRSSGVA